MVGGRLPMFDDCRVLRFSLFLAHYISPRNARCQAYASCRRWLSSLQVRCISEFSTKRAVYEGVKETARFATMLHANGRHLIEMAVYL